MWGFEAVAEQELTGSWSGKAPRGAGGGAGVSCGVRLRISRQAERKRALGPDQREKWMLATARDTQKELRGPKS